MRNGRDDLFADRTKISAIVVPVIKSMPLLNPKSTFFSSLSSFRWRVSKNSKVMDDSHESIFDHICVIVIPKMSSYDSSKPIIIIKLIMKSVLI